MGVEIGTFEHAGDAYVVLSLPREAELPDPADELTRSERAVLRELLAGRGTVEIARRRGTSTRTVANQIRAIYRKLRVGSRAELVALAASWRGP